MADLISYAIEGAVAVGTIGLTILTAYQLRRDRREAVARELADRVYVPMRQEALRWQSPESSPHLPTWKEIEDNSPYLVPRVPSELRNLFQKARAIERSISAYTETLTSLIRSQTIEVGSNTTVHIFKDQQFLGFVYPLYLWISGKDLQQYVRDYIGYSYPLVKEWSLELHVDVPTNQRVGGNKEAIDYMEKLVRFLESKPEAVSVRKNYRELAEIGAEAQAQIEKKLRKRVAPMSSSPAKEPGNPFG